MRRKLKLSKKLAQSKILCWMMFPACRGNGQLSEQTWFKLKLKQKSFERGSIFDESQTKLLASAKIEWPWKLCYFCKKNRFQFKVGLSPSKKVVIVCFSESPLKMMKNAFYFMLKAIFVLSFWLCKVNFKICDVTDWTTNNCNTHIAQYLKK